MMGAGSAADWSDQQLLARFVSVRDEDAFAVLMERHGRLVWSTCQRMLHDTHAAEDAFQATFMILVRKAMTIRRGVTLPSWLHRVAFRVALYARTQAGRLRTEPTEVDTMPAREPNNEAQWKEIRPILDEEINRLPEKYRAPIVLCYLQGKTNEEAARQLGWTKGTVSGRLARARELLRTRLIGRGVSLSAGALAVVVSDQASAGAVPASLVKATLQAASLFAAGQTLATGAVSPTASALVKGVMTEMCTSKLKVITLAMLYVSAVGTSTGAVAYWARTDDPALKAPSSGRPAPPSTEPNAADLQKLQGSWGIVDGELDGSKRRAALENPLEDSLAFVFDGKWLRFRPERTFADGRIRRIFGGGDFDKPMKLMFALDATKEPKTIDFILGNAVTRGIYRFNGDALEICVGTSRPTQFAANGDPDLAVFVLKRMTNTAGGESATGSEGKLVELSKAKRDVARELLRIRMLEFKAGREYCQLSCEAAQLVRDSELELAANKERRLSVLQAYFDVLKEVEEICMQLERAGRMTQRDVLIATYRRLEAEQALEREKAK
jgi:RNA polymerase sigma factor (sigma-70 family)